MNAVLGIVRIAFQLGVESGYEEAIRLSFCKDGRIFGDELEAGLIVTTFDLDESFA